MMNRTILASVAALVMLSCTTLSTDPRLPTEVLDAALVAAQNQDWGSLDLLLTPRLSRAISPGSLAPTWQTLGADLEVVEDTVVGSTAHVWVRGDLTLSQAAQGLQVPLPTLQDWLETPDPEDPDYLQASTRLAALTLDGENVSAMSRITLYRQPEGWRVESWQLDPLPGTELPFSTSPQEELSPPVQSDQSEQESGTSPEDIDLDTLLAPAESEE